MVENARACYLNALDHTERADFMVDVPDLPPPRARLGSLQLFPELRGKTYLSFASVAPPSTAVREAINRSLQDTAERGPDAWMSWHEQRQRLKKSLSLLVAGRASDIALLPNTSTGLLAIAQCFPWKPGDKILLFEGEFPANVIPWQQAAALFGLELVYTPIAPLMRDGDPDYSLYKAALQKGIRMVAASLVQFQTGFQMPIRPLADLAHESGAAFAVDAVQGLGAMLFDATHVDFLSCGGHKWLCGPEGIGFVYINPRHLPLLRPYYSGWESVEDPADFLFGQPGKLRYDKSVRRTTDFLEIGTMPTHMAAGLEAAVQPLLMLGPGRIFSHIQRYYDRLEPAMIERGFQSLRAKQCAYRSGIFSLKPPADIDPAALVQKLRAHNIYISCPDGYIRIAAHWPNNVTEILPFLQALDHAMDELRANGPHA